jgi:uncharacterized membrane protein YqjE
MRNHELLKYGGLATQIIVTLGVTIFIGIKIDKQTNLKFPIATILLPLLVLIGIFWKVYKDSTKK